MFLQILMLTRQNKCHATYFFKTRVSPNGFLCSEVLTQCCLVWSHERHSWEGSWLATNRWLVTGTGQDQRYLGQVHWVKIRGVGLSSGSVASWGPEGVIVSFWALTSRKANKEWCRRSFANGEVSCSWQVLWEERFRRSGSWGGILEAS